MNPVLIIGAGGHAAVVADALLAAGETVLGFTDAEPSRHGQLLCGKPVLGGDELLAQHTPGALRLANGIGGTRTGSARAAIQRRLENQGWRFTEVRHPSCVVSPFARICAGAQLLARSVVQAGADIGAGSIVNTAAVIEHDSKLGEFVHASPGAIVCGNVSIGAHSHIGAGAVVRQGVTLGEHTLVAAGAVVIKDFKGAGTLVGTPAEQRELTA